MNRPKTSQEKRNLLPPQLVQPYNRRVNPVDDYYANEYGRLNDEAQEIEHTVDTALEDINRVVSARLKSERERIINHARVVINEEKRRITTGYPGGSTSRNSFAIKINPKFLSNISSLEIFTTDPTDDVFVKTIPPYIDTLKHRPTVPSNHYPKHGGPYSIYESMSVLTVIGKNDALGCAIERPKCVEPLILGGRDSCAVFSHNNSRVSIVSSSGQLISTFMLCHEISEPIFFSNIAYLCADDIGKVYVVDDRFMHKVFVFSPLQQLEKSLVVPSLFCELEDTNGVPRYKYTQTQCPVRKIHGISSLGSALFIATDIDIRVVSLSDGRVVLKNPLPTPHKFATTLHCVQSEAVDWRLTGVTCPSNFLVYSTWNGGELYRVPFSEKTGRVERQERQMLAEIGQDHGSVRGVASAACDLEGNMVVSEEGNCRLQVFASDGRSLCSFAPLKSEISNSNCSGNFKPSGVAVISSAQLDATEHRRPVVVVADSGRNCVILFAPKFR